MNGHDKSGKLQLGGVFLGAGKLSGVRAGLGSGVSIVPESTPLTRLNYFDGQFLRAEHLNREQRYLRRLVELSNQADGGGITHGFNLTLAGDTLRLSDGLAIDREGRVLLLPEEFSISVADLIEKSRQTFRPGIAIKSGKSEFGDCVRIVDDDLDPTTPQSSLYLIVIAHTEVLCGQEDVYGRLCEDACVSSTQRPYWLEGVMLRAIPLPLSSPLPTSSALALTRTHLRSRVASAYFEQERQAIASLISKNGLRSNTWCLGADAEGGSALPIGVLARAGSVTLFLDAWTARRERIETPPHRYWQWRMAMRPKDVFLAQVLQFQCQLRDLLKSGGGLPEDDPCAGTRRVLAEAVESFGQLTQFYADVADRFASEPIANLSSYSMLSKRGTAPLVAMHEKLTSAKDLAVAAASTQFLIDGGIIELPSAGYLPVAPGDAMTVNEQVRRLIGEGVDLRFCAVRHDFVPHAWEEAQHMERISLIEGLSDDARKPRVDILVPDGTIRQRPPKAAGVAFRVRSGRKEVRLEIEGVARFEQSTSAGLRFYSAQTGATQNSVYGRAAASLSAASNAKRHLATILTNRVLGQPQATAEFSPRGSTAAWASLEIDRDPLSLTANEQTSLRCRIVSLGESAELHDIEAFGTLRIVRVSNTSSGSYGVSVEGVLNGSYRHDVRQNGQMTAGEVPSKPTRVRIVRLTGDSDAIRVQLADEKSTFLALKLVISSDPIKASAAIRLATPSAELPEIPVDLEADDAVLIPGNSHYTLARSALQILQAALAEEGFADAAAKLLFATPESKVNESSVIATRDWVLFHRRREKDCGQDTPKPAPLPERRYRILHLALPPSAELRLDRIRELLFRNSPELERLPFEASGEVIFAGGEADLVTPAASVRADWERLRPGPEIVYAAIGSRGAAEDEGAALAASRLGAAVGALDPVSRLRPGAALDDLPEAPFAAGTDGSIVVITVAEVTIEKHRVYAVRNLDAFKLATNMALRGEWTTLEGQQIGVRLGDVRFEQGKLDPSPEDISKLDSKWRAEGFDSPILGYFVTAGTDLPIPKDRTRQIAEALGQPSLSVEGAAGLANVEADVAAVCLLLGERTAPSPAPNPSLGRTARVVFVPRGQLQEAAAGNVQDLFPDRQFFVQYKGDGTLDGPIENFPQELRSRVRRLAAGVPGGSNDAQIERRSKSLVGGLIQQGLVPRGSAAGGYNFDLESIPLASSLSSLLTGGASELVLIEIV